MDPIFYKMKPYLKKKKKWWIHHLIEGKRLLRSPIFVEKQLFQKQQQERFLGLLDQPIGVLSDVQIGSQWHAYLSSILQSCITPYFSNHPSITID